MSDEDNQYIRNVFILKDRRIQQWSQQGCHLLCWFSLQYRNTHRSDRGSSRCFTSRLFHSDMWNYPWKTKLRKSQQLYSDRWVTVSIWGHLNDVMIIRNVFFRSGMFDERLFLDPLKGISLWPLVGGRTIKEIDQTSLIFDNLSSCIRNIKSGWFFSSVEISDRSDPIAYTFDGLIHLWISISHFHLFSITN